VAPAGPAGWFTTLTVSAPSRERPLSAPSRRCSRRREPGGVAPLGDLAGGLGAGRVGWRLCENAIAVHRRAISFRRYGRYRANNPNARPTEQWDCSFPLHFGVFTQPGWTAGIRVGASTRANISKAPLQASTASSWARSGKPSRTRNRSSWEQHVAGAVDLGREIIRAALIGVQLDHQPAMRLFDPLGVGPRCQVEDCVDLLDTPVAACRLGAAPTSVSARADEFVAPVGVKAI
jgi:hypothetical protein